MTHEEMVQIVGHALELEKKKNDAQQKYSKLEGEKYPALNVKEPVKGNFKPEKYPQAISKMNMNSIWIISAIILVGGIICGGIFGIFSKIKVIAMFSVLGSIIFFLSFLVALILPLVYYLTKFEPERKADVIRIKNSPEYQQQCQIIDQKNVQALNNIELDYQQKMTIYKQVLGKYNEEKNIWTINHNVESLEYIYGIVSTSEYDFKEAAADWEREKQNNIEIQRVYAQQDQNALLEEQNRIAEKTRRDANIQAVVGVVQNHNLNKALNGINSSLNPKK